VIFQSLGLEIKSLGLGPETKCLGSQVLTTRLPIAPF